MQLRWSWSWFEIGRIGLSGLAGRAALAGLLGVFGLLGLAGPCLAGPAATKWTSLPKPSPLPTPDEQGVVKLEDVALWYASFGKGDPVVLLHGGLGNSDHYGDLVQALRPRYRVIVIDSRGHGRSTRSAHGISYAQMADDVIALLDHLHLDRASIVGWSDGGVTGLDVALRYPDRIAKLFIIGTNYDIKGVKPPSRSTTFTEYFARCKREYKKLAPDPKQLAPLLKELRVMWAKQPTYREAQLAKIQAPVLVALGEHDEIIRRDHVEKLAKLLPHGTLKILPDVSHFALWQDPKQFADAVVEFLK
jgi:pimeloyl-ACP methyl ester carboxylesterase